MEDVKIVSRIYPFEKLENVGSKITLDENDNIASVRAMCTKFKKINSHLGWDIKVIRDYSSGEMVIFRSK